MKKDYLKYFLALLMFGSNGIAASHISLSSTSIVLQRSVAAVLRHLISSKPAKYRRLLTQIGPWNIIKCCTW